MTSFVRVCEASAIVEGKALVVDHGVEKVLLIRLGDEVRAYDGRCPHARSVFVAGPLADGRYVECPMHGARFDSADGALQPGPVTCPGLTAWPIRLCADGVVSVAVPAPREVDRGSRRPPSWGAAVSRTAASRTPDLEDTA